MDKQVLQGITLKSVEEIVAQLRELVHRHRRRYVRKNLRPCPDNCKSATLSRRHGVTGCSGCNSSNPEVCRREEKFVPLYTKEELIENFREDLRDRKILSHDYRDILTLLWVLGEFDEGKPVPEAVISSVEVHQGAKR
jgi:hypothetical protein